MNDNSQLMEEPIAEVIIEPDYYSRGHFHEGTRKILRQLKSVADLPVGTKLFAKLEERD